MVAVNLLVCDVNFSSENVNSNLYTHCTYSIDVERKVEINFC